jgi:hypothetical protein
MKKSKIMTAVGGILIALGLIGVVWGIQPAKGTETLTIPSGDGYFGYLKISGWLNGHLSGDFSVTSDGIVNFYILDPSQYDEYSYDLQPSDNMKSISASTGEFSVDLPSSGSYYMAIDHGSGYESMTQTVEINFEVTGFDMIFLFGGIVLAAIGAVVSLLGLRVRAKETVDVTAKPTISDVTVFDEKPKPPN